MVDTFLLDDYTYLLNDCKFMLKNLLYFDAGDIIVFAVMVFYK